MGRRINTKKVKMAKKTSIKIIKEKTLKGFITFDSEVFPKIRKMLGLKNLRCSYCKKRITKNNIGGILSNKRIICRNPICMIRAIGNSDL